MIALYVDGARIGSLAEAERLLPEMIGQSKVVALHDDGNGMKLATLTPEPLCPWEPDLTKEEIARRCERPGKSLSKILARLGAAERA